VLAIPFDRLTHTNRDSENLEQAQESRVESSTIMIMQEVSMCRTNSRTIDEPSHYSFEPHGRMQDLERPHVDMSYFKKKRNYPSPMHVSAARKSASAGIKRDSSAPTSIPREVFGSGKYINANEGQRSSSSPAVSPYHPSISSEVQSEDHFELLLRQLKFGHRRHSEPAMHVVDMREFNALVEKTLDFPPSMSAMKHNTRSPSRGVSVEVGRRTFGQDSHDFVTLNCDVEALSLGVGVTTHQDQQQAIVAAAFARNKKINNLVGGSVDRVNNQVIVLKHLYMILSKRSHIAYCLLG
jgi:hypothetical protein